MTALHEFGTRSLAELTAIVNGHRQAPGLARTHYHSYGSGHPETHTQDKHSYSALTIGNVLRATAADAAGFTQLLHSELGSVGANDHHAQSHTHASHTSIGANDHHAQAHGADDHTNRTRYVSLHWQYQVSDRAYSADNHGGAPFDDAAHVDFADGVDFYMYAAPFMLPADYVSGTVTLKYQISSSAAGNNVNTLHKIDELPQTDGTASRTVLLNTTTGRACNGTANRTQIVSEALSSNPTAGCSIFVTLGFLRSSGDDTNTGTVALGAVWLEYTADG